jgi:hypothetical protein
VEEFFIQSFTVDKVETEELLLRRYSNIDYILNLDNEEGYEFILKAYEKSVEEKLWEQWLVQYRFMNKDNFISFEEFKDSLIRKPNAKRKILSNENLTLKEIEDKVKSIIDLTV